MMNQRPLAVSSLNLILGGSSFDPQDLVVVLALALLQLELGVLKELPVLVVAALSPEQINTVKSC